MSSEGATSPLRRLFGSGSIYTIATAAPMLSGFIVTPLLTRTLGLSEYDQLSLALVAMNFTLSLLAFGLPVAITRRALAGADGEASARGIVLVGAGASLLVGLPAALGVMLLTQNPALSLAIVAGSLGGGVAMTQAIALARSEAWIYVALATGLSLLAPAAGLLAVTTIGPRADVYYAALAGTYAVVALLGYARLLRAPLRASPGEFVRALRIGIPVVPHQLSIGSVAAAAVVVAQLQFANGAAAQTQLALLLASAPLIIISALSYAWMPMIMATPEGAQGSNLEHTADRVAWLAVCGAGALAMLSPWLLRFLAPAEEFGVTQMVPLVSLACAAVPVAAGFIAHSQLVLASGKTAWLAVLSPTAVLLGATASFLLVAPLGLNAVGVGFVATYVLLFLFMRSLARRVSPVRWRESRMVLAIAVGVVVCGVAVMLPVDAGVGADVIRLTCAAALLSAALTLFIRGVRVPRSLR